MKLARVSKNVTLGKGRLTLPLSPTIIPKNLYAMHPADGQTIPGSLGKFSQPQPPSPRCWKRNSTVTCFAFANTLYLCVKASCLFLKPCTEEPLLVRA